MTKRKSKKYSIVPPWVLAADRETLKQLALKSIQSSRLGLTQTGSLFDKIVDELEEAAGELPKRRTVSDESRTLAMWRLEGSPKLPDKEGSLEWGRIGYLARFGLNWDEPCVRVAVSRKDLSPLFPRRPGDEKKNDLRREIGQTESRKQSRRVVRYNEVKDAMETLANASTAQLQKALDEVSLPADHRRILAVSDVSINNANGATFGERLREARESRGWSIRKLAAEAGMQHPNITAYEKGRQDPGTRIVQRLADALHVDPATLQPSATTGK